MLSPVQSSGHYLSVWPLLASRETNDLEDVSQKWGEVPKDSSQVQIGTFQGCDRQKIQFVYFCGITLAY